MAYICAAQLNGMDLQTLVDRCKSAQLEMQNTAYSYWQQLAFLPYIRLICLYDLPWAMVECSNGKINRRSNSKIWLGEFWL